MIKIANLQGFVLRLRTVDLLSRPQQPHRPYSAPTPHNKPQNQTQIHPQQN